MYQKFELKNRLPVILIPKKESQSLTLLVIYKVGSRYENFKVEHGVSHFIEHLMFKGTKKRPSTLKISQELDGVGAEYNAYTSKDHTGYYIKVNAEKLELACDILSDMLYNSLFDPKEIEKEKGVIIEEIKMYQDQPIQYAEMLFEKLVFEGSDLAPDIAGTEKSIRKMASDEIINYKSIFYNPQNAVLVIAGKIDKKTKNVLNKYFVRFSKGKMTKKTFKKFENKQKELRLHLEYKKTKQVHLALGFPAYSYSHPDLHALYVLSVILGGNMSSRLFINVRERRGLCYYIRAQADVYQDTGNLMIRAGLDINKIKEAIQVIIAELKAIKNKGISQNELEKAKEFLKGRITLQLEDLNELAEFYGRQLILTNKILTPQERIKKILKVKRAQVNKVAKDLIKNDKLNLAMIAPFKEKGEFIKLLKI